MKNSSSAGIVNTGKERVIPASRRPDGTVRREIKVRQGYTPPEDVQKYQSKAQLIQARAQGYIAGLGVVEQTQSKLPKKKSNQESLELIIHGLLQEMRLEDLKQILESFSDSYIDEKLGFDQMKVTTIQNILNCFRKDSKAVGEKIFSIAKLSELRRLVQVLNLSDGGDRNTILGKIHQELKSRFKKVYTMDLTRSFDDFQSVSSVPLEEPKNKIMAQLVEIDNSREAYEKKLKALKKKLRQIEVIQGKDSTELLPEQIEKLNSKDRIISEIDKIQESLSGLGIKN